jgi:aspartyl-tRNA(Asn)/glutamyl-tRNA(Gln) amidotransferase subunit A
MSDFLKLSLTEAAQAIREKKVSSVELTQAALARAHALQSKFNAFVRFDDELALTAARACDAELAAGKSRGPLHGVPLAHKDMFYRKGMVSTCGSRLREHWKADTTATVLEKLDAAGALQLGTLNMTEFAYGPTGQNGWLGDARNPWNPDYITGGSSAGSGVSVASRMVFAALGSDTGGSVRMPSSICGVTGMKTTFSRVSRAGCMPLSQSLDTIGPLTRTVEDNALMLSVIAGFDARDGATLQVPVPDYVAAAKPGSLKGLKLGIPRGFFDEKLEDDVRAVLDAAAKVYAGLGAEVIEVKMPDVDVANAAGFLVTWGDVHTIHSEWMARRSGEYSPQTRGRIEVTLGTTGRDYVDAQRYRGRGLRDFCEQVFTKCDALLAPVLSFAVPKISEVDVTGGPNMLRILDEITRLMRPVNMLGLPGLALPAGFTPNGLPCGMQMIGRPFAEPLLYRIGAAYQGATDWHTRMPTAAR